MRSISILVRVIHPILELPQFDPAFDLIAKIQQRAKSPDVKREAAYLRPRIAYNVARAFARDSELKEAFEWMHRAIDLGFEDKDVVSDPDLEALRSLPEFGALVAKFEARNI